jgi:hypothetical protein
MPVFSTQDLCFIRLNKQNVAHPSLSIRMPTTEVGGNLRSFTRRRKTFPRRPQLHFNYLKHEIPHESTSLSSSPRYLKHH